MPLTIIRQDIVKLDVNAIVSSIHPTLDLGHGVDQRIATAAGPDYKEELSQHARLTHDDVFVTSGYNLPSRYIFHVVTPYWQGGFNNEVEDLIECYNQVLSKAVEYHLESIAFPLLSSGNNRFPKERAIKTALSVLERFVLAHDMDVFLVLYDQTSYFISQKLSISVKNYIESRFRDEDEYNVRNLQSHEEVRSSYEIHGNSTRRSRSLQSILNEIGETFTERLFRYIDEKGLSDPQVYRRANMDRRLFSRIRSHRHYQPSKPTVIALAIALELNLDQTNDLLHSAGLALSRAHVFDLIVEYFIRNENYNIFEINEVLYDYQQQPLGQ